MTRAHAYAAPPGAERLGRIRVAPGTVRAATGRSCTLLLAHDPIAAGEDAAAVSQDMLGIATGLGLTPAGRPSRHLVHRAYLTGTTVLLDYGHEHLLLQGLADEAWSALAAASGYVRLSVGLDARPDDEGTDVHLFTDAATARGRLWAGITTVRVAAPRRPR